MRGDGVVEDLDGGFPPQDMRVVGDDDAMISPSEREVPPTESLHRRARVLLLKFRLETAALCPESPLLIFSRLK